MNKPQILQEIAELVERQEDAIQAHPAETVALYVKCRDAFMDAFIEGLPPPEETEQSSPMFLTLDDLSLVNRYVLASSFISAWYHLAGDKANRNKAAHSCSLLVASLGNDPEEVMLQYIEFEQRWRLTMKSAGIAPRRFHLRFIALLVVLAVIGITFAHNLRQVAKELRQRFAIRRVVR